MLRLPVLVFCSLLAIFLAGCSGESFPLAPVSGRVTMDGEPLAGARVGFEPRAEGESQVAGWGSYGQTDQEGRFTLTTVHGEPGAVVGRHRVWIRTFQNPGAEGGETVPEQVPARYNEQTELEFEVTKSGSDEANFDLTSR